MVFCPTEKVQKTIIRGKKRREGRGMRKQCSQKSSKGKVGRPNPKGERRVKGAYTVGISKALLYWERDRRKGGENGKMNWAAPLSSKRSSMWKKKMRSHF